MNATDTGNCTRDGKPAVEWTANRYHAGILHGFRGGQHS